MSKTVEAQCLFCGKIFNALLKDIKRGYGKYCSRSCSALAKHQKYDQTRSSNPNWRNGRSFDPYNSYTKDYKCANEDKIKAQNLIATEIRAGRLTPFPCELCGKFPTDAHHDDYAKPYEIRWLCRKHHNALHKG